MAYFIKDKGGSENKRLELKEQLELILRNTQEVVTKDKLRKLLEREGEKHAYVGFEPSGKVHLGWLMITEKIKDLNECGFSVTLFLADWHAYINDKFGGDIGKIRKCGKYMEVCFEALGVDMERNDVVYASRHVNDENYWERVFRIAKRSTLARIRRAMTIMGREEDEADVDSSKFFYPPMQAADIFQLDVDLALGGLDQRRAHMLALDAAEKLKWKKPVALHTPILTGLDSGGRMDTIEGKMSKSDPDSCIFIHDDRETIRRKLKKAFCPQGEIEGNPVLDLAAYITFPFVGELLIERPEKWGGDLRFDEFEDLLVAFEREDVHPLDVKMAIAEALYGILEPAQRILKERYGSLEAVENMEFLN